MTEAIAEFAPTPRQRRSATPAPIDAWHRALLLALLALALGGFLAWRQTPLPTALDQRDFAEQFASLDRQVELARRAGSDPLRIVFIGTSRIRNAALDPVEIAASARSAGIQRPVASTTIGVNWGGFERFAPAETMIAWRNPDVVVIMPELLEEDFTALTRLRIGKSWAEQAFWGKDFVLFAEKESQLQVCMGFDQSPEERQAENSRTVTAALDGPGPRAARAFVRRMAAAGTRVIIADLPVTAPLQALRPPLPAEAEYPARVGLGGVPGVSAAFIVKPLASDAYCDVAHLDPKKASVWQTAFFRHAGDRLQFPAR